MTKNTSSTLWKCLALWLVIPGLMFAASCAKMLSGSSTSATRQQHAWDSEWERFVNEDINFEYDKYRLLPKSKKILRHKAKWLRAHPDVAIVIEGHCDERGSNHYNMVLGAKRARSARNFLINRGIAPERLTTKSYGEEIPLDRRHNEKAWAKNRRAHFIRPRFG